MRVVRIYHAGRSPAHRGRERALVAAGVDLTLIVPTAWPEGGGQETLTAEPFRIVEVPVTRAGDVNRHTYSDPLAIERTIAAASPDVVDIHEEPFSAVTHQLLGLLPPSTPVVTYTAQNLDKRYPPPFGG